MKKALLAVATAGCLVLALPLLVVLMALSATGEQPACARGTAPTSLAVVQANIKTTMPADQFADDLNTTLSTTPDLVSLNEVAYRPDALLTRPGYGMWREPDPAIRRADGTAVMWRTDRWTAIHNGRVVLLDHGPQKWDHDRAATWVTLRATADPSQTVSMVSVHQMINPAKYGPNMPLRQRLYAEGMAKLATLVVTLSQLGPVFVAGDFNSQYADNDPWGPRSMLGQIGMVSSMDVLGVRSTHDGGGTIDYIFFQPSVVSASAQTVTDLHSDHHLLATAFNRSTASPDDGGCQGASIGDSAYVMPLPSGSGAVDLHNWGGSGSLWSHWHTGTDFSVACGTPVYAVNSGTVEIDKRESWAGPWLVKVSSGPGSLTTWYAHMQTVLVEPGSVVQAGDQIGEVGAEGNATGCHLHFEVHTAGGSIYGPDNVDPSAWLADSVERRG